MQFTEEQVLDAPMARVEDVYWNFEYCPRKYRELGLQAIKVLETRRDGDDYAITCSFKMKPSISVPKIAQKFVGGSDFLDVVQTDSWNTKEGKGRLDIDIRQFKGVVKIHCDMSLEPHERGTVNRMVWHVECTLPLIGGKLAKYLAEDIKSKFDDDCEVANRLIHEM